MVDDSARAEGIVRMGRCVFEERVPEVEIRNGMAFINTGNAEIVTTVANLHTFVARCHRELDRWREGRAEIIEFPQTHG